jgi:hypothetical protein
MWGHLNRTHVVGALAATLGVMVGGAAVAAWDVADSDDPYRVYSPPAINIDRLAEASASDAPAISGDVSGGDRISSFGRGFVDVASLDAAVSSAAPVSFDGGVSSAERISATGNGFVDVASLEASISANAPVTFEGGVSSSERITGTGTGLMNIDDVIAEHEAAIAGAGLGTGQVFSE